MAEFSMWDIGSAPNMQMIGALTQIQNLSRMSGENQMIPDLIKQEHMKTQQQEMQFQREQAYQALWKKQQSQQQAAAAAASAPARADAQWSASSQFIDTEMQQAGLMAQAGLVGEATNLYKAATEQQYKLSLSDKDQADAELARIKGQETLRNDMTAALSMIDPNSPNAQQQFNQLVGIYQQRTGQSLPYANQQFSQGLKDRIMEASMSEKDQLHARVEEIRAKAYARNQDNEAKMRTLNHNIDYIRQASQARAEGQAAAKVGSGKMSASATDLREATDLIVGEDAALETVPQENIRGVAQRVVEGAKKLREQNPGLEPSEAMAQAYLSPDIQNMIRTERGLQGLTKERPLPLPEVSNKGSLKRGKWYTDGTSAQRWNGSGWDTK